MHTRAAATGTAVWLSLAAGCAAEFDSAGDDLAFGGTKGDVGAPGTTEGAAFPDFNLHRIAPDAVFFSGQAVSASPVASFGTDPATPDLLAHLSDTAVVGALNTASTGRRVHPAAILAILGQQGDAVDATNIARIAEALRAQAAAYPRQAPEGSFAGRAADTGQRIFYTNRATYAVGFFASAEQAFRRVHALWTDLCAALDPNPDRCHFFPFNEGFIGGRCESDDDCLYPGGTCYSNNGSNTGSKFCVAPCTYRIGADNICRDRFLDGVGYVDGFASTFCVELDDAPQCVAQQSVPAAGTEAGCPTGFAPQKRARYHGNRERTVCLPTPPEPHEEAPANRAAPSSDGTYQEVTTGAHYQVAMQIPLEGAAAPVEPLRLSRARGSSVVGRLAIEVRKGVGGDWHCTAGVVPAFRLTGGAGLLRPNLARAGGHLRVVEASGLETRDLVSMSLTWSSNEATDVTYRAALSRAQLRTLGQSDPELFGDLLAGPFVDWVGSQQPIPDLTTEFLVRAEVPSELVVQPTILVDGAGPQIAWHPGCVRLGSAQALELPVSLFFECWAPDGSDIPCPVSGEATP